ncbi:hypothetical protein A1O7_05356 [Cladophialophora yegresii CBS 114405]|uniref:Uncharacterized protein n=1 Tax=Cladophialophora yegresii CBS 114405 TaxID=1182544 RepID=W9VQW0_9EURO|nr:uncharacterized protein A1O7_05356 [Cladophialophora yegresii CBS 114405]EXJ57933.1 hypothetical protein A1O7_05356 [Cladophialophora yegresii CBS 114405]
MDPLSPKSPMPTPSPRSPHSPMAIGMTMISPLPQLVTSFSTEHVLQRQASLSAMLMTPRSGGTTAPWRLSNGSTCRRNSLTSPITSPAYYTYSIHTPTRTYSHTMHMHTPTTATYRQDCRQSRMAMRSPTQGRGTTMTLPLRVNTNLPNVREEDYSSARFSSGSTLSDWAPTTTTTATTLTASPTNSRRLIRSHTPAPITTRSPIRKRPKLSRFPRAGRLPQPPQYHVTVVPPPASPRTQRQRQDYLHSVDHLRTPLVPLISVATGLPHPQFPTSLLQYHLLTHDQLDSLARWYHQVEPAVQETFLYPACIPAWTSLHDEDRQVEVDLETKRRRWGRFIGLRGCESPGTETNEHGNPIETREELSRRMEREWRRALERAEEESRAFEKSWRGRW